MTCTWRSVQGHDREGESGALHTQGLHRELRSVAVPGGQWGDTEDFRSHVITSS